MHDSHGASHSQDATTRAISNADRELSVRICRLRNLWVPNDYSRQCMGGLLHTARFNARCSVTFSSVERRHHCRMCGLVLCGSCCCEYRVLPTAFKYSGSQLVCFMCSSLCDEERACSTLTPADMLDYRKRALTHGEHLMVQDHDNRAGASTMRPESNELTSAQYLATMGFDTTATVGGSGEPTVEEIKKRYYKLMLKLHPDRHGGKYVDEAHETRYREVERAYMWLTRDAETVTSDAAAQVEREKREASERALKEHAEFTSEHYLMAVDGEVPSCTQCKRKFSLVLWRCVTSTYLLNTYRAFDT